MTEGATMQLDLKGHTALVTGASSGLGAHFAATLAHAGAHVILGARREDALKIVADGIRSGGGDCNTIALDVTDSAAIATYSSLFSGVDILVNNAGIVREAPLLQQSEDDWDAVLDANLKGMFLMTRAFACARIAVGRGGNIINIASILGLRQGGGVAPYATSKAGAIQLTKVSALELARYNIRVNALAPGYFVTDLNRDFWDSDAGKAMMKRIPQRRVGQPADLDGPLLMLASDASRYMTGSVIEIDGGHLLSTL